jgi:hypothetical protein
MAIVQRGSLFRGFDQIFFILFHLLQDFDFNKEILARNPIYMIFPTSGGRIDGSLFGKHFSIPKVQPFYFKRCSAKQINGKTKQKQFLFLLCNKGCF